MNSLNTLKKRVEALQEKQFEKMLRNMSDADLLEFAAELSERRAGAMDAKAKGKK